MSYLPAQSERVEDEPQPNEIGDEVEVETRETSIEKQEPLCLAFKTGGIKRKWRTEELEILHNVSRKKEKTLEEKYEDFKTQCMSENIPFRTKKAFKVKLSRL